MDDPLFTPAQQAQIKQFLQVIIDSGGYGIISLEIKKGEIRFITLETSAMVEKQDNNRCNK